MADPAAREAREVAKEARELFVHRATKVKDTLHPSMLVMAILYPVVIGFSLQARGWHFSLAHPRPDADEFNRDVKEGDLNQWVTFSASVFTRTVMSFIACSVVHIYLLGHMHIKGPRGVPRLRGFYRCFGAFSFAWVGMTYFYTYASLSRYGTHLADWIATAVFSGIIFVFTLIFVLSPRSAGRVIDDLEAHAVHAA